MPCSLQTVLQGVADYTSLILLIVIMFQRITVIATNIINWKHCRTADSCKCYQSQGFCYDMHSKQYRSSILEQSAMYHGDNLSNSLPKWHLYAWLVPRPKSCSCLAQLAGKNTTFTAMRNAVFFERASHWSTQNRIPFIFSIHFPVVQGILQTP